MKVLHVPLNVASQISITVGGLREIGVEARGLARRVSVIQDYRGIETMDWTVKPRGLARLKRSIRWRVSLLRAMRWADVIHWHWGESTWNGLDLKLAAAMKKPRLVEFWGSDVRDPVRATRDNPFLARMYEQFPELVETRSAAAQRLFQRHGFVCLIPGFELADYLDPGLFGGYYQTRALFPVHEYDPIYPEPEKQVPVVAHAPSNKQRKGTEAVLAAVRKLSSRMPFEFNLIDHVPRSQALALVARCDVFLDQFTVGAEGLAAHEAMALGKPVMCYIKPSLLPRYPKSFPIVAADQSNLDVQLMALLQDGQRRHQLGRQSRQYMETHHDARLVARELVRVYEELLQACPPGSRGAAWQKTPLQT